MSKRYLEKQSQPTIKAIYYDYELVQGPESLTLFWTGGGGGGQICPPAGFLNIAQKPLGLVS